MNLLPTELVTEAIREGEIRVQAQLAAAIAADQRALTLAGFQIGAATAAMAGSAALLVAGRDFIIAGCAIAFSAGLIIAAWLAVSTVRPSGFFFPGNDPENWLPSKWISATMADSTAQARMEQASNLSLMIKDNAENAEILAKKVNHSMNITLFVVSTASITLMIIGLFRS